MMAVPMLISCKQAKKCCFVVVVVVCLFFCLFLQGDEGGTWLVFSYRIIPDYGGEYTHE